MYTLKMGSYYWVVVADADIAREVMVKKAKYFSDRPTWLGPLQRNKVLFGDYGRYT